MLKYFILFTIMGLIIGFVQKNNKVAFSVFFCIAIFWGISSQVIWGLVSFGEMTFGWFIGMLINNFKNNDN